MTTPVETWYGPLGIVLIVLFLSEPRLIHRCHCFVEKNLDDSRLGATVTEERYWDAQPLLLHLRTRHEGGAISTPG
jgi:hypothetical protein